MESTPYLLFSLHGVRYAVDARAVREIFWLPELTPAEEAPPHIAGVVNLRGRIEPVANLELRFGHPPTRYRLSDSVVLLKAEDMSMGVIVHEVHDVAEIPADAIEPPPRYDQETTPHARFIIGEAKVNETIVSLLDAASLIHAPPLGAAAAAPPAFCPEATPEEREVFRSRARSRMQAEGSEDTAGQTPLAVVGLGGEYFGMELEAVREFAHLRHVVPAPCCPAHIAGNMNLRGDILTLVDIRPALKLPQQDAMAQVVVAEAGQLRVGVPVAQVFDVLYLRAADVAPPPAASGRSDDEYCKGVAHYGEKMVGILDMRKILAEGGLEVDEEA